MIAPEYVAIASGSIVHTKIVIALNATGSAQAAIEETKRIARSLIDAGYTRYSVYKTGNGATDDVLVVVFRVELPVVEPNFIWHGK